jgi:multicomponent Na+:H+ antiporter subunit C
MSVLLGLTASTLVGIGVYLLLQRRLSRIIIGLGLLGHGANLLLLLSGNGGLPAFVGSSDAGSLADPLPQALILTAIVITFGVTAFLLALAYRSWQLDGDDEVEDDVEDRLIARHGDVDKDVLDEELAEAESTVAQREPS